MRSLLWIMGVLLAVWGFVVYQMEQRQCTALIQWAEMPPPTSWTFWCESKMFLSIYFFTPILVLAMSICLGAAHLIRRVKRNTISG